MNRCVKITTDKLVVGVCFSHLILSLSYISDCLQLFFFLLLFAGYPTVSKSRGIDKASTGNVDTDTNGSTAATT